MPLYEYRCVACDRVYEELVFGSAAPPCPACGSSRVEKQMSVPARPASGTADVPPAVLGGCGTCGDPRGPGACKMN
jgi:putative FmdB family regulatory protein